MHRSICQQNILSTKEGWFLQASYQPQAVKSVHGQFALQDGEPGHVEGFTETRRLDGIYRPERRLPLSSNLGGTPEIPAVHLEWQTI